MNTPKISCAVSTCTHNLKTAEEGYGHCNCPKDIILKFRAAGDFGNGTIVFLECINQELPQDE